MKWSGRWESNPRLKLGKLGYYHYTTPAIGLILVVLRKIRQLGFDVLAEKSPELAARWRV
jgi:hypothetical protein